MFVTLCAFAQNMFSNSPNEHVKDNYFAQWPFICISLATLKKWRKKWRMLCLSQLFKPFMIKLRSKT